MREQLAKKIRRNIYKLDKLDPRDREYLTLNNGQVISDSARRSYQLAKKFKEV